MKFNESSLPDDPLIRQAFDYAQTEVMKQEPETLEIYAREVNNIFDAHLQALEAHIAAGGIPDADAKKQIEEIELTRKRQLQQATRIVRQELQEAFVSRCVLPALEFSAHATSANPEIIAVLLLSRTLRSPVDFKKLEATFGASIANVAADIIHAEIYPSERKANAEKMPAAQRKAYLALICASLTDVVGQYERMMKEHPGGRISFPAGQEQEIFSSAAPFLSADKKLAARFAEQFNVVAKLLRSSYTVETDPQSGVLTLVKSAVSTAIVKRPPPKGPSNIGGDVF